MSHAYCQITYDLPHRVRCSKFYPISPPPSNTGKDVLTPSIIVYGHDQGVTVVWKGFKIQQKRHNSEQQVPEVDQRNKNLRKGSRKRVSTSEIDDGGRKRRLRRDVDLPEESEDVQMLEAPTPSRVIESAQSKSLSSEAEVHTQTVYLGAAVYDVSFVPSTIIASVSPSFSAEITFVPAEGEEIPLASMLLKNYIVMAVACSDNSIRLISLPLHPSPSSTPQILTLAGVSGHRSTPTTLSLTLVTPSQKAEQSSTRTNILTNPPHEILIASASPDVSGVLLLWRIGLERSQTYEPPVLFVKPKGPRTFPLSFPALHVRFNPSSSSSLSRHNLLVADSVGALRILDTEKGIWLVSLYMDYPTYSQTRKKILGVDWCLDGQGIVTLSGDGEWGVFELLGKGKYVTCGRVGDSLESSLSGSKRYGPGGTTIFSGSSTSSSSTGGGTSTARSIRSVSARSNQPSSTHLTKGILAVTILPSLTSDLFSDITPKAISSNHEMLVLAYENEVVIVPSIQETLDAKKRGSSEKTRTIELKEVVLGGEDVSSLDIRWFVGNKVDNVSVQPPESRRASSDFENALRGVKNEASDDEDDGYYIDHNGDVVRGNKSSELDKHSPSFKVVIGAGARLNVLDIEEEVLSTSIAAKALVAAKAGLGGEFGFPGAGVAGRSMGAEFAQSPRWSASPLSSMLGGVARESGPGKRKAI
ncbi:hypothetical protein BDZ91DRAFT_794531 [Kalaharituber pfeilii]|nr:hypothetical protein BDZ91DRAFT_794531 [Kalaharituber pfeilii]